MAREITLTLSVNVRKGKLRYPFNPGSVAINQATTGLDARTVIVNTSAYEAVPTGDIAAVRYCFGRSLDGTNYVSLGVLKSTTGSTAVREFSKIRAGDPYLIPGSTNLDAGHWVWKANAAAVRMHHHVVET